MPDDFASITGLERELIPTRPPAPGHTPPEPITPERAAHNRAVLEAAIRRPNPQAAA
ncbi:hypothetical protein SAMN06297387_12862 [Streptomyces zhaozhouensis]|uniref:Uncharacterized protein n=1 Tax=Streptomyces zhaozhouensis TaxID=1300267 RepID=A0A286E8B3_9ACTN|nr:hypothetical protein [Streptomyces zhaozhouensis]SOD67094.1 hypothetical protein SAMN06297387_12862 [Streptomyces zhaozhouensis]